jgi:type IV pilus assembly protein PilY1
MNNAKRILLMALAAYLPLSALALTLHPQPLFLAATEPRVMLVASRDHQLSIKAYTDYSDLDNDGVLDTSYKDSFSYYGYFDSNKCYSYSSNRYSPSSAVNSGTHQCSGSTWSGNFLNWASMTRMDILRKTFYGGYRSTDSTTETVLERHFLPVDVHAFVKLYTPTGSMPSIQSLTGISGQTSISLCNVSDSTDTDLTGTSSFTMPDPLIKVAAGTWPQWATSEVTQCALAGGTQPTALLGTAYVARVKVCDATGGVEANCKTYTHPVTTTTPATTIKPVGLLQRYSDVDADRRVRFGLMTGSYAKNKSGGVLRKNTALLANNNGAAINSSTSCSTASSATTVNGNANDEIDVCTGQFINQAATQAGIINTLNRLRIAGFKYSSAGKNASYGYSCSSSPSSAFTDGQCVDWGNPLAETYLETLRYFANAGATTDFNFSDATILASIPQVTWSDPLPSTEWCALSSIILLSTGLNSYDTDQLASFTPSGGSAIDAASLTNTVGSLQGITGDYLIGDNGTTANNQCTAKTINLATAKGICPEEPSTQGGYGIAGLAYAPKSQDLRHAYATLRNKRWGDDPSTVAIDPINADWALRQPINTYAVQLAESLPSFSPTVGSGKVTLLPACQANNNSSSVWYNCSMADLIVNPNVAMALDPLNPTVPYVGSDATAKTNTCSGNGTSSQCYTVSWDGYTWGGDYDMDGIQRLGYCVGSACDTFKMLCPSTSSATNTIGPFFKSTSPNVSIDSDKIVIATCAIQANAGDQLRFGYTVTGTGPTTDGAKFPILRPGGSGCTTTPSGNCFHVGHPLPSTVTVADSVTYTQSGSSPQLLENPLWYAAKFGSFTESTPATGTPAPNLTSEWDKVNNTTGAAGADGIPDNYYDVKNPAKLAAAMAKIFDAASQGDASASSVATNSTNLKTESRVFQAKFSNADWSGQLLSYKIGTSGIVPAAARPSCWDAAALQEPPWAEWDASCQVNAQNPTSGRVILTKGATDGVAFTAGTITSTQQTDLATNIPAGRTYTDVVNYLRGSATHEGTSATSFRQRNTSKLGDIVNSSPWYVGEPKAGYSDVDHPGYSAFRTSYKNRLPVVYVAGNDGMLHGFDASLNYSSVSIGAPTGTSGKEVLAYIPSVIYPNLSKLTGQKYNKNHIYFVDGSPMVGDAYLPSMTSGTEWRSVLVGGLGAGGKGYYALDITNPGSVTSAGVVTAGTFSEANAASLLLWEFDETDMGYAFNMPPAHSTNQAKQIVKMANGKWAAIVGNGYSTSAGGTGKAVLYILFIDDGVDGWASGDYVKIVADATGANGLSTPVPFDSDGDGLVDTVYAGDLKGKMWKFFVGPNAVDNTVTATPSTWKVALSGAAGCTTCTPLFTASDGGSGVQPITWPAEVTLHPNGGQMVLFGTGKYLENTDNGNADVQSFYGIWDQNTTDQNTTVLRSSLVQQTVLLETITVAGVSKPFRTTSANPVNYLTHKGWYLNLPTSRERMTGVPKLDAGTIWFNTFIPSTSACEGGGTGWLMGLNYLNGKMPSIVLFDTNNDGFINGSDIIVSGFQVGAALGGTTLIKSAAPNSPGIGVSSLTSGALTSTLMNLGGAGTRGRINWREIVQ